MHAFGGPEVMVYENCDRPEPGPGEVLIRVQAAGLGPWDAEIRRGKWREIFDYPLPLILGTDLAGVVEGTGGDGEEFRPGQAVFGVADMTLSGSHAEYALGRSGALAELPAGLALTVAAGAPVVACAAIQMLHDIAHVRPGQTVLVHGGAGAVGSCAVQMAAHRGARVAATASGRDRDYVHALGAETVVDYRGERFEDEVRSVDAVIDTVGGETLSRSIGVVLPGGVIVTSPEPPSALQRDQADALGVRLEFLEVEVTTRRLRDVGGLLTAGTLTLTIAPTAPLSKSRRAHELLESSHRGKIVLVTDQA